MKKIIFADNDTTIQEVVHLILDNDYQVISHMGGEELLNNSFEIPDLFLLSSRLGEIDGLEVCKHLKGRDATRHVPVIIVSSEQNISRRAKAAGAEGVILKPFSIQELRRVIAAQLR